MDPGSCAVTIGATAALVGLGAGVLYAFGGVPVDIANGQLGWGTVMAFGALVGMPAIFGAIGAVSAAVVALAYNRVARRTGGIGLSLTD